MLDRQSGQGGHPCHRVCPAVHGRRSLPWLAPVCGSRERPPDTHPLPRGVGGGHGGESGPKWPL